MATRLVAAQVVPGLLAWTVPGGVALLLMWVWGVMPIRHERREYGGQKG